MTKTPGHTPGQTPEPGRGKPDPMERLALLADAYLHRELSPEGLAELEAMIQGDPVNAERFIAVTEQAGMMREVFTNVTDQLELVEDKETDDFLSILSELDAPEDESPAPIDFTAELARREMEAKEKERRVRRARIQRHHHEISGVSRAMVIPPIAVWLGLAAVLGIAATVFYQLNRPAPQATTPPVVEQAPQPTHQGPTEVAPIAPVADLTGHFDTAWLASKPTGSGELLPGTYTLTQGWAQIETARGVAVVLEAPVTFELNAGNALVLTQGQLVADVPQQAHGFTVHTPSGRVIDYGTTFGVAVNNAGTTLAHVFTGEIALAPEGQEAAQAVRLVVDEAAAFRRGREVRRIEASPERFAREVPATAYQAAIMKSRPMCYWRGPVDPATRRLTDHGWLGADGLASAALRHDRAGFAEDDPSGSLDFGRNDGAAVSADAHEVFGLTRSFSVEAWCWIEPGHEGFMRIVSTRTERGGFGFGVNGRSSEESIGNAPANAPVFTRFQESDYIGDAVLPEARWVHLAAAVDADGQVAMWVDGAPIRVRAVDDLEGEPAPTSASPLMIGRNPFTGQGAQPWQGRLDEVAIYDRALSQDEINEHYNALQGP